MTTNSNLFAQLMAANCFGFTVRFAHSLDNTSLEVETLFFDEYDHPLPDDQAEPLLRLLPPALISPVETEA